MNDTANTATAEATQAVETQAPDPASLINTADLKAPIVTNQDFKFTFKKQTDELGNKRAPVTLTLPIPTFEGVIEALKEEKQRQYILDILAEQVRSAASWQVGDDDKPVNTQSELDVTKLTLSYLANMPKAERTGGGIAKEVWEAMAKDYIAVMPGVTGKDVEKVSNAATIFLKKFQPVKTNKGVLKVLKDFLAQWFMATPNAEEFKECYEFLDQKVDALLAADEASLLANL